MKRDRVEYNKKWRAANPDYLRKWRARNKEKCKEYDRAYREARGVVPKTAESIKSKKDSCEKWARNNLEKRARSSARHVKKFPLKHRARQFLARALRAGKVKKSCCLICGLKAQAHHPDYKKPLEITWLCAIHHKAWHRTLTAEE